MVIFYIVPGNHAEEHAKRVRGGIPGSELPEGIVNDVLREVTPKEN